MAIIDPFKQQAEAPSIVDPFAAKEETPAVSKTKGNWAESAKAAGSDFMQAADMILSLPGQAAKVSVAQWSSILNLLRNEENPLAKANEIAENWSSEGIGKFLNAPIETATGFKPHESGVVSEMFGKLGEAVESGANAVSSATGSDEAGAAAKQLFDIAGLAIEGAGIRAGMKYDGKANQTIDDLVHEIRKEEAVADTPAAASAPVGDVKIIDPMAEGLNPQQWAEIHSKTEGMELESMPKKAEPVKDTGPLEWEIVDPATLRTQQGELPLTDMERVNYKDHATPEQGIEHVQRIPTDVTQTKGTEILQESLFPHDRSRTSPNKGKFGQGGSVDPKVFEEAFMKLFNKTDEGTSTTNNASGESAASVEAINRLAQQNAAGISMWEVDPNTNQLIPLKTADRVDKRAQKGKAIVQRSKDGKLTIIENNSGFNDTALTNRSQYLINQDFLRSKAPLGGTGKKGFGQGGAVGFGGGKKTPPSLEKRIRSMSKEDFRGAFAEKYPEYVNRPEVADRVYDTFQSKLKQPSDFGNSKLAKGLDKGLGVLSTRIGNISQNVLHRAIKFEEGILKNTHKKIGEVDDFILGIGKLDKEAQARFNTALINNDIPAITALAKEYNITGFDRVRQVLKETGVELQKAGRLGDMRQDYFPRIVTDIDGLKKVLGAESRNALETRLLEAERKFIGRGEPFTDEARTKIINQYFRNTANPSYKPGFSKTRVLNEVPEEFHQFYATPAEALHTYLRNAVQEIETSKFFGREAIRDPETGKVNIDQSIGNVVLEELKRGKIKGDQASELESMLRSRFGPGNRSSNSIVQGVKDVANLGLLGNFISAGTQLGDVAMSVYLNGLRPTLMAAIQMAGGISKVNMKDFGLLDHISEEFVSTSTTSRLLNSVFKYSGFSAIDRLGKNTVLNGTLNRALADAKTPKGIENLRREWEPRFGEEFPQLLEDLQRGELTDTVQTMLFSKLSKMQPITKLELPQKYLDMPNGRIVYMLKSFMLKQMDVVRNDFYNELQKGNVRTALGNITKYAATMGIAGATTQYIKDWLLGRDVDPELDDIPLNILKTFGWSEYAGNKIKRGAIGEAIGDVALPPYKMFDQLFKDALAEDPTYKSLNYFPVVGRMLYSWNLGGAEEYNRELFYKQIRGDE